MKQLIESVYHLHRMKELAEESFNTMSDLLKVMEKQESFYTIEDFERVNQAITEAEDQIDMYVESLRKSFKKFAEL